MTSETTNRKHVVDNYFKIGGLTVHEEVTKKSMLEAGVYSQKTRKVAPRVDSTESKTKMPVF
jgi:hypothetical protein